MDLDIEPMKLATKLLAVREQIALEFVDDLILIWKADKALLGEMMAMLQTAVELDEAEAEAEAELVLVLRSKLPMMRLVPPVTKRMTIRLLLYHHHHHPPHRRRRLCHPRRSKCIRRSCRTCPRGRHRLHSARTTSTSFTTFAPRPASTVSSEV